MTGIVISVTQVDGFLVRMGGWGLEYISDFSNSMPTWILQVGPGYCG